jgi:hypothetical protein
MDTPPAPPIAPAAAAAPLRLLTRRPGRDQITLTPADGRYLCFARQHRTLGKLADVLVTFGELGEVFKDSLWRETWGTTYAMCAGCWHTTATIAQAHRPRLVIHDHRQAAPPPPATGTRPG